MLRFLALFLGLTTLASSAHAQAPQPGPPTAPRRESVATTAPTSVALERYRDVTIEFASRGSTHLATCRVFPDGTRTCLPSPVPRRRVGAALLGVGTVVLTGGALLAGFGGAVHAFDCLFAEPGCTPNAAPLWGGVVVSAVGAVILTFGAVRARQHHVGVRRLGVGAVTSGDARGVTLRFTF